MLTVNQINSQLKAKAESHAQVKSYIGFAETEGWNAGLMNDVQYPIIGAMLLPSTVSQSTNTININIRLVSADRQKKGNTDVVEVLSDRLQVFNDIITMLRRDLSGQAVISNDIQVTPFDDLTNDECAGWYGDLTFQIPNPADYCAIPRL